QEYVFLNPTDAFNMKRDYTNSYFDRRHVFTGFFVYDLPFGKGHQFGTTGFLSKLLGGWAISSAITASSGLPQKVYNNNSCTELGDGYLSQCASWTPTGSAAHTSFSRHTMPDGSVNVCNHMEFTDPSQVDISNTTTFGETSTQYNSPRFLNIGIRIDF